MLLLIRSVPGDGEPLKEVSEEVDDYQDYYHDDNEHSEAERSKEDFEYLECIQQLF